MEESKTNEVLFIRTIMNITQDRLALLLNCALSTIKTWEKPNRKTNPNPVSLLALRMMHFIIDRGLYDEFVAHHRFHEKKMSDGVTPKEIRLLRQLAQLETSKDNSSFINAD